MTRIASDCNATGRRVASERAGHWAEYAAAASLVLRGYRLLERRRRTPYGELDLIAVRGRRLAFVEVKHRQNRAAGDASLSRAQSARMHAAAAYWLARKPHFRDYDQGFDAVFVLPWRWPNYLRDLLQPAL